jgi:hypothetical protein
VSFDVDNPFEISCFSVLHPDRLVHESAGKPDVTLNLAEVLAGPAPYTTLVLADGIELHHQPASTEPVNTIAAALADRSGYDGSGIRGAVHLTGSSGDTDTAAGMTDPDFETLYGELASVCNDLGVRLWRKIRPADLVTIRYTDLTTGDLFWFGGKPHRLMQVKDCLPGQGSKLSPEAKIMIFDDGGEFWWYPTGTFHDRADHAPAGYWQRTGNQLLPAEA